MTNFSIMTKKGTEYINQVLNTTNNKIMADGWYIELGTGELEPTENTEKLINPIFGKDDCSGIVFGSDEYGHYAEILIPKDILKNHITEIGLFNNEDLLITVAKTDINLPDNFNYDVKQRIYIKAISSYITVEYISNDLYLTKINEQINSVETNKASIDLDNLSEEGIEKLNEGKLPIGSIFPCVCSDGWTPENSLPCNGAEYSKSQFPNLWTNYLQPAVYNPKPFNIIGSPEISADGVVNGMTTNTTNRVTMDLNTEEATELMLSVDLICSYVPEELLTGAVFGFETQVFYVYCNCLPNGDFQYDMHLRKDETTLIENISYHKNKLGDRITLKWELKNSIWTLSILNNGVVKAQTKITEADNLLPLKINDFRLCSADSSGMGVNTDLKTVKLVIDGKTVINGSQPRLATCSYEQYASDIEAYGQCAKFAVDEENETFRIPTIKDGAYITQALSAEEIGKSYNESLPNIEGTIQPIPTYGFAAEGVFYKKEGTTGTVREDSGSADYIVGLDASRASSAYQNGAKVQGDNVRLRYFVVVATGAINKSAMDWSEWATSLGGKMNVSASNISSEGKSALANLSMPSSKYDSLSIGSSGTTYTAPANGWFCFKMYCTKSPAFVGLFYPATDGNANEYFASFGWNNQADTYNVYYLPAKKGQQVAITYKNATVSVENGSFLHFVYAEGNATESEE